MNAYTRASFCAWETWTLRGRMFLGLRSPDGNFRVFDAGMFGYGAFYSRASFQRYFLRDGDALRLTTPDGTVITPGPAKTDGRPVVRS